MRFAAVIDGSGYDVVLDDVETEFVHRAGEARAGRAEALGLRDAYGYQGDSAALHVYGATSELAVAKSLDYYWRPLGHLPSENAPDVGPFDVRSTTHLNPHLRIRPADPDDRSTVLVWLRGGIRIMGWIRNVDAKKAQWWGDKWGTGRGDSWELPASALQPFAGLTLTPKRGSKTSADWLCEACRVAVALRDGICGKCWLERWSSE